MLLLRASDSFFSVDSITHFKKHIMMNTSPRHAQLTAQLRDDIVSGRLLVGERLPPEIDLALTHNVSRATLRRALGELEAEGLIDRRRRAGTVVAANQPKKSLRVTTSSFPDLLSIAKNSRLQLLATRHVADGSSAVLGQRRSSTGYWLEITAERFLQPSGPPVSWQLTYIDGAYAGVAPLLTDQTGAIFELIENLFHLRIARLSQTVTAVACPELAAQSLGIAPGQPAMQLEAEFYDEQDRLIELAHSIYDPSRYRMQMDAFMP